MSSGGNAAQSPTQKYRAFCVDIHVSLAGLYGSSAGTKAVLWICMALLQVDTGHRLVSSGGDAV